MEAALRSSAGRNDGPRPAIEDGRMKKRLLITGIVVAALLLALYLVFGTGAD